MARTLTEIYDSMNAEKQNMASLTDLAPAVNDTQTLLTDLNSPSKVAHWRLQANPNRSIYRYKSMAVCFAYGT